MSFASPLDPCAQPGKSVPLDGRARQAQLARRVPPITKRPKRRATLGTHRKRKSEVAIFPHRFDPARAGLASQGCATKTRRPARLSKPSSRATTMRRAGQGARRDTGLRGVPQGFGRSEGPAAARSRSKSDGISTACSVPAPTARAAIRAIEPQILPLALSRVLCATGSKGLSARTLCRAVTGESDK